MPKITRAGLTFQPDLLKDFDAIITKMGYGNRSKAVQNAVRMFVSERGKRDFKRKKGTQTGVLMMLYNHETKGLGNALTHVQHHYAHITCQQCTFTSAKKTVLKR